MPSLLRRPLNLCALVLLGAACASAPVVRPKDALPKQVTRLHIDDLRFTDSLGASDPRFAQAFRDRLMAAGFELVVDAAQPYDFDLEAHGEQEACLSGCFAKATLTFRHEGVVAAEITEQVSTSMGTDGSVQKLVVQLVDAAKRSPQLLAAIAKLNAPAPAKEPAPKGVAPAAAPKPQALVAILPLHVREAAIPSSARETLEESMRTVAADSLSMSGYTILTAENTLQLLTDNGVDAEKVDEASSALELARKLKVRAFVAGSIAGTGQGLIAFIRFYDQSNGQQLSVLQLEAANAEELRRTFEEKGDKFFTSGLEQLGAAQ